MEKQFQANLDKDRMIAHLKHHLSGQILLEKCFWQALLPLLLCLPGHIAAQSLERFSYQERCMGTLFQLSLYAPTEAEADQAARQVFALFHLCDSLMSDYQPNSQLNQLSGLAGTGRWMEVHPLLLAVLMEAKTAARQTRGRFDPTIGPLVRHWRNLRRQVREGNPPLPPFEASDGQRALVNYRNLKIRQNSAQVYLRKPGMQLDLGGIAKGFACQQAADWLTKAGYPHFLIDGGGDLTLGAPPPGRAGWNVKVGSLHEKGRTYLLQLSDCSVATSGDLFQFVVLDGKRYAHLIDPSTGMGLPEQLQLTVIAPGGTQADFLATALSIAHSRQWKRLAKKHRVQALKMRWIPEKEQLQTEWTEGFEKRMAAGQQ